MLDPGGVWFFNWVIPIAATLVIVAAVLDCVRRRRLTWGFLFLSNSMLVYWMETMGDWGQHLIYSPTFAHHSLLEWLPVKTPIDPLFMPFAYAVYWTVHAIAVLLLGQLLMRKFGWSLLTSIAVLALPVNYVWDVFAEGIATAMGWWTYDPGFGPVIEWAGGGRLPLMWPILLMTFWPNLIAYWAGKSPVRSLNHMERFMRLDRFTRPKVPTVATATVPAGAAGPGAATAQVRRGTDAEYDARLDYEVTIPRWRFELARFGAWFVVFQVSFFLTLIVPLVTLRAVTGHDSPYIP
ncbi:hypothetical protein C5E45_18985 [Nocardia nova]|uniref:Spirocyclase, AveC family n=1 Tax=Nocardia nova TaxID=37330 RepID=A0A2S6AN65_9NOCA|nr:hypothetical protein C5E41_19275 [Nocardia nova]PPJ36675.1 hypothetical protein C5E45_18985 [Nocardia nova]